MSSQNKQTSKSMMPKQNKINRTRERSPSPEPEYKSKYEQQKYEKKKYEVPSKETYFFDRSKQPMAEICEETNYFQQLPDDIKFPMLQFICEQSYEGPSVYGEYAAPPERETVESINGKGGYFLKKTTEAAGIYLIWHNRQKNIYKFWGPTERAVRDAMNRIRGRIVKYVVHIQAHSETKIQHQAPVDYKLNNKDLAATPPPREPIKPSIYFSRVFKEDDQGWSANFVASVDDYAEQTPLRRTKSLSHGPTVKNTSKHHLVNQEDDYPPPLMRSASMAVADAYNYEPEDKNEEEEEECQPRLCRSISMM